MLPPPVLDVPMSNTENQQNGPEPNSPIYANDDDEDNNKGEDFQMQS